MKTSRLPFALVALLLFACSDDPAAETAGSGMPGSAAAQPGADHGDAMDLGQVTLIGREFGIARLGELVPGSEGAFQVRPIGAVASELADLNVYLWIESQDGTQLSAPAKGGYEDGTLHFHATPRAGEKAPFRVMLRLRADDMDERASLPLDGHGHEHPSGPHAGVPAKFTAGEASGYLELKLHDNNGDLELWLFQSAEFAEPFDVATDAKVELSFVDVDGRKITMQPRNLEKNEDEAGQANMRAGKTNYFIFPGSSGADATWLQGKDFQSIVSLRISNAGSELVSEEFVLSPHAH